jgi:hypothetical protein
MGAWRIHRENVELKMQLGVYRVAPKRIIIDNLNADTGDPRTEMDAIFRRYFDEHGLVSLAKLSAVLENGGGNGNGRRRLALPAPTPVLPNIPGQRPKRISGEGEEDKPKD